MYLSIVLVVLLNCLCVESLPQGQDSGLLPQALNTCPCTPFFKCNDDAMGINLDDLVDDRINIIDNRTIITLRQGNDPSSNCLDPVLEIPCCNPFDDTPPQPTNPPRSPPVTPSPKPINVTPAIPTIVQPNDPPGEPSGVRIPDVGECGVRNMEGVGFTVEGFKSGQAQYGEFPWMVAVLASSADSGAESGPVLNLSPVFVGGGSLLDPLVVLTAAHKPYDNEGKTLIARIGEWNFRADTEPTKHQDIPVKEVIYHPRFVRNTREYNYALLILERPAVLGQTVRTICLPSNPGQRFDGAQCIVSGWGKDVFGEPGVFSRILKEVEVNMVGYSQCQTALQGTRLGSSFSLHRSFVCAGDQGQDACTGDGGSPLVCPDPTSPGQYVQVGVSAWGIGCGAVGIPGVYAAVAPAIEWIQGQIAIVHATLFDDRSRPGAN